MNDEEVIKYFDTLAECYKVLIKTQEALLEGPEEIQQEETITRDHSRKIS